MGQTDVEYYINGINFINYGVYVSASSGITSKLEVKERLSVDWNSYHGISIDTNSLTIFKERTINLDCFIEAFGYDDFISKCKDFISNFEQKGTQRFKIDVGLKPLVYEIICIDPFDISKKWDPDLMIGTFKLKLIEPEPVKRVLKSVNDATITLTSTKRLNIYWGDGTHTFDVIGEKTLTHTFTSTTEIIITGVIEDITNFSTNCEIIWNNLH